MMKKKFILAAREIFVDYYEVEAETEEEAQALFDNDEAEYVCSKHVDTYVTEILED